MAPTSRAGIITCNTGLKSQLGSRAQRVRLRAMRAPTMTPNTPMMVNGPRNHRTRTRTSVAKKLDIRECELPFEGLYCERARLTRKPTQEGKRGVQESRQWPVDEGSHHEV
jgi:hypothetical protein